MREELISPYAVTSAQFVKYDALLKDKEYLNNIDKKGTEKQIIEILYKYGVLTKMCIKKALLLAKCNVKRDISNTLKRMQQDGALITYERRENRHVTVLYALSMFIREEIENSDKNRQRLKLEKTMPDMLMRASLNQWHIGILQAYQGKISEERYYSKKRWQYKSGFFLSCIKIKSGQDNMTLLGLPFAKTKESIKRTILYLAKMTTCIETSASLKNLVVVMVESLQQMESAYKMIISIREFSLIEPFFALDVNTKSENTICWLYACEIDRGAFHYDTYHLDDILESHLRTK